MITAYLTIARTVGLPNFDTAAEFAAFMREHSTNAHVFVEYVDWPLERGYASQPPKMLNVVHVVHVAEAVT